MSNAAKKAVSIIGALVLGMLGTAIFDWRLPPWLLREQAAQPAVPLVVDWWIVGLLGAACVGVAVIVLIVVFSEQDKTPQVHEYRRDSFFGVVWRWGYVGNQIVKMACFCRICDRQLTFEEVERWPTTTTANCKMHGEQHRFQGEYFQLIDDAMYEVQRKLRCDEWKQVVERERGAAPESPSA